MNLNIKQTILHFSISELKLRYRGTVLGFLWSILEPLVQLGVLYLIFSSIRPSNEDFIAYLFIGLIFIHFFSRSTTQGMNSIINKKSIVISLNIPKIIFPTSIVLSNLYMFGIEMAIFFGMVLILAIPIQSTIVLLPVIIIILIALTVGISFILATVRLYFKDIQSIWSIITMSLIFITPIFWKVEEMSKEVSQILLLNPLALLIEISHQIILFEKFPTLEQFTYVLLTTAIVFGFGLWLFNKKEKKMTEML